MSKSSADTPLMQQHRAIKQKFPDAILLFRVGDFYETFGEDAIHASRILGITLTKRNNGAPSSSELAGFPHHALETYLHKLVKGGFRVAICDQLEDPKTAKGIVKRGVTELVTPGLAMHDKMLEHGANNFLAALHYGENSVGLAFLDISTGEFLVSEGPKEYADKLLQTFKPAEVIFQRQRQKEFRDTYGDGFYTYTLESWIFEEAYAHESLLKHFQTHSLKGFGVEDLAAGQVAASAILHYLRETEHPHLQHLTRLQRIDAGDHLWMDQFTVRNLELMGGPGHTLLGTLDHTVSPMGARLLRRWLLMPLNQLAEINERLNSVEWLVHAATLRQELATDIRACGDLERLAGKIPTGRIVPRELLQLAVALELTAKTKAALALQADAGLCRLSSAMDACSALSGQIRFTISSDAPAGPPKGQSICAGVDAGLDELKAISSGGKQYLVELQQREAAATGISSLRIGFNHVFGYYLEVTHLHKSKVPASWIRKQTLANAERYVTAELKEYEEKITGAEDRILAIETKLYENILLAAQPFIATLQRNAHALASIDCLTCFADTAIRSGYTKPVVHGGASLSLKASRHPVIEKHLAPGNDYIPSDIVLDPASQQIIILTGPNMAGKSALLRQTALITLMAHAGSFVPASSASIPLTDKIFTRVGASDNLSGGESTFMVEMNETASILNNLSARSLVILDEIGRGTSTYDGISIAWSIVEFLHASGAAPKTLFATHYHELNELEHRLPRVRNYHISSRESGNRIIFLRKMIPGGSMHSFGIHVARMAGLPLSLTERAAEVLRQLEASRAAADSATQQIAAPATQVQLSIFDAYSETFDEIRKLLKGLDIDHLTPVEALLKLSEIRKMIH